jgi:hypothetical protein
LKNSHGEEDVPFSMSSPLIAVRTTQKPRRSARVMAGCGVGAVVGWSWLAVKSARVSGSW